MLVRSARNSPSKTISSELFRLVGLFHVDADLDVPVALALLLAVVIELIIRLRDYSQWPYLVYTPCSKHNPDGYIVVCMHFFQILDEQLDEGFGLPLRRLASRAYRARWL